MFNLAGALFYLAVAAAAWRAALHCRQATFHWRAIALLFAGLAAWRIGYGEAVVQGWVRDAAQAAGSYELRRDWQAPVTALVLLAGAIWALWLIIAPPAERLLRWSRFASLALLAYSGLRLMSFHPVDALIYRGPGPFHFNHAIDLGLAAFVGYCAILAARRAQAAPRGETVER